jgi:hypothetical protein
METKQTYAVFLMKRDQEHLMVLETEQFEEADKKWFEMRDLWTECLKSQTPFTLRSPMITAFDPGMIYEISLVPKIKTETVRNPANPYAQRMNKEGLAATMGNRGSEMLDGGFNR